MRIIRIYINHGYNNHCFHNIILSNCPIIYIRIIPIQMGNQVVVDPQPVLIEDMLEMNVQALASSWNYLNTNKTPIMMRVWRISLDQGQMCQEMVDFVTERNIGIGFNRDEAYIVISIVDLKCSISEPKKIPFYTKMFLDSLNNVLSWEKNNTYRRKYDGFVLQTSLIKGKRLSAHHLLKALSIYFQLEIKMKQAEEKFLQALFQGAVLSNSKLIKRQLVFSVEQKVECPLEQIHNFHEKVQNFPVLKQIFCNKKSRKFDQFPIEQGINYWYLFSQQSAQNPFQLDITHIKPQNPIDFSDFENQLEMGLQEQQNPIISPQLGDMSLSLLNQLKPVVRYEFPISKPNKGKSLLETNFYLLCKQKVNGVDVVLWEGKQWSRDEDAVAEFMERVISENYAHWPDNKIFVHERGYDLN